MSASGSTRPSGWMTFVVVVARDHVQQRVGLADVGEELVAEALALVRARHQAGDVVDLDRVRDDARGPDRARHGVEPLVATGTHRDVRLDRREGVVRGLRAGRRERVEQRRLARVGHPDDPDLHRRPSAPERRCRARRRRRCRTGSARRGRGARTPSRRAAPYERRARQQRAERRAAANDEVECDDGNERPVGVAIRCGRSSTDRAAAADRDLDRGREQRRRSPTHAGRAQPAPAAPAVDGRAGHPEREPHRAVLAQPRVARAPSGRSPACGRASARAGRARGRAR